MQSVMTTVHIVSFLISLVAFGYAAVSAGLTSKRDQSMHKVGVASGVVGVFATAGLIFNGGSIQHVCISGVVYAVVSVVLYRYATSRSYVKN